MARKPVEDAITPEVSTLEASTSESSTPAKAASARAASARAASPKSAVTSVAKVKTVPRKAATATEIVPAKKTRQRIRPETRAQMLERLMNPEVSLHEASVILGVCRATVRRYADMGTLVHERTEGRQRRFHLRDVLALSRTRETEKRKRR